MSGALVMKFGGSSVGTTAALTQVLSIILHEHKHWDRMVLVASALDGVTDALLEAAQLAQLSNRRGYRRITATLRTRHLALIDQLPLGHVERNALHADIDRLLFDMLDICQGIANTHSDTLPPETSDAIIGVGERLSARIIAALLRQNGLRGVAIDATDLIITDSVYSNATPDMRLTGERIQQNLLPMLGRQIIPVITGFVGSTPDGKPTTLGRGGSDYTASILSTCIDASELWVWSGVDGMMTSDPREVPDARVIPELSYHEVAELAYFGARILHPRMIGPLYERRIPLRVKNVYKPQQPGTLIGDYSDEQTAGIKAVTSIQGVGLTAEYSGSLSGVAKLVDDTLFASIGSRADVMISSQSSSHSLLCFVIPTSAGLDIVDDVCAILQQRLHQQPEGQVWQVRPISVLTAIRGGLDQHPELVARILLALDGVRILALAQGPSNCSFSVVVRPADAERALHQLHRLVLKND